MHQRLCPWPSVHSVAFFFLSLWQQNVGAGQTGPSPSVSKVETSDMCDTACSAPLFLTSNVASIKSSGSTATRSREKASHFVHGHVIETRALGMCGRGRLYIASCGLKLEAVVFASSHVKQLWQHNASVVAKLQISRRRFCQFTQREALECRVYQLLKTAFAGCGHGLCGARVQSFFTIPCLV